VTGSTDHQAWTEAQVDVDGVGLHVHRTGRRDRPALVLAHGLSDSGRCWGLVAGALAEHFDIVMLDARNHGRSDTAPTSPDLLVADVAAVIASLGLERPAVMGHSVGAHTMALLASRHPGSVSQLVLEDPPWTADGEHGHGPDDPQVERRAEIRAWLGSFAGMTDAEIAEAGRIQHADWPDEEYPSWIESNRQVRVEAADGLAFGGWGEVVDGIGCPTFLVFGDGERGGIVTPAVAGRIVERNAHVTSEQIDDAGHNIRRENFGRFIEVVGGFLRDHRTTTPDR